MTATEVPLIKSAEQTSTCSMSPAWLEAIEQACRRIAPTWPLDQMIAVNPFWEMRDQPFAEVAARLAALSQVHCLMPKAHYQALWGREIEAHHLAEATREMDLAFDQQALLDHLREPDGLGLGHWHNISDLLDSSRDRQHKMGWRDEITHQISQFCAAVFQQGGPLAQPKEQTLYQHWLNITRQDRGIAILMDEPDLPTQFQALPADAWQVLQQALEALDVPEAIIGDYLHALLLDINGWASWVAYLRWQNRLDATDDTLMQELLAIRVAWELVLWRHHLQHDDQSAKRLTFLWRKQLNNLPRLIEEHRQSQRLTWVWQRAAELAYQHTLQQQLQKPSPQPTQETPVLQAAFCIDVRSEVIRRALEAQHPGIQTRGFAGFFGLPLEYQPQGTDFKRPQLPGLLKPAIEVTETQAPNGLAAKRALRFNAKARWKAVGEAPPAAFSLVETTGLLYAFKLFKDSLFPSACTHPVNDLESPTAWQLSRQNEPLSIAEQAKLAAGILTAMGLSQGFAETVLLVGHGSRSRNNPQAAGLDCGACGGQTGEINARVLAQLLNNTQVRQALAEEGIAIPETTRFVPALHNTTTDEIQCFDHRLSEQQLQWLDQAGRQARCERAETLGLAPLQGKALERSIRQRAIDWSQVRPEWGLANNAAFIVAPRSRTAHLNLEGRVFLHDYQWRQDTQFKVLELIMTAPMVVTHWINMQYNASVADNYKYGSGNKVLHNVVGGNLGVFEGNGGDLRIGLALQSVHDGERWMHQPLRLSVYLAAPREPIETIVASHEIVREMVDNEWIYLFRLDDDGKMIERFYKGHWN